MCLAWMLGIQAVHQISWFACCRSWVASNVPVLRKQLTKSARKAAPAILESLWNSSAACSCNKTETSLDTTAQPSQSAVVRKFDSMPVLTHLLVVLRPWLQVSRISVVFSYRIQSCSIFLNCSICGILCCFSNVSYINLVWSCLACCNCAVCNDGVIFQMPVTSFSSSCSPRVGAIFLNPRKVRTWRADLNLVAVHALLHVPHEEADSICDSKHCKTDNPYTVYVFWTLAFAVLVTSSQSYLCDWLL